jgi:hypothetical protein
MQKASFEGDRRWSGVRYEEPGRIHVASCHEYGVANEGVERGPVLSHYVVSNSIDASSEEAKAQLTPCENISSNRRRSS